VQLTTQINSRVQQLYLPALVLIAIGLPFSKVLMSIGTIGLMLAWILEGQMLLKWKMLLKNKAAVLFISVFLMHLIALLYTNDFDYALRDIRIKLPLLVFPLAMATMAPVSKRKLNIVLLIFVLSTLFSTIYSYLIYTGAIDSKYDFTDVRYISVFISHIRLALLVTTCICIILFFLPYIHLFLQISGLLTIIWMLYFLYILESFTGFTVLFLCFVFYVFYRLITSRHKKIYIFLLLILISVCLIIFLWIKTELNEFYTPKESHIPTQTHTQNGEPYIHNLQSEEMENGYYTYLYYAPKELDSTWNLRSTIHIDSLDNKKQLIRFTLIRYLTSKGLKKDAQGVSALTQQDINNIENGIANINYVKYKGVKKRLHQIIFEIQTYLLRGNPSGNSITQRFEYWKTGIRIFLENPWIGVGTGDVQRAFDKKYSENNSLLAQKYRLHTHNQYLTFFIAFGALGGILFLASLITPWIYALKKQYMLYVYFMIIAAISFFTEDTLETQAGVTFFAFFNSFFYFLHKE
jgi:hypothetical protein